MEWGYLLGLALPGGLLAVTFSLMRLLGEVVPRSLGGQLDMMKSVVFLSLGLAMGGVALLQLLRGSVGQKLALVGLQCVWIFLVTVELSSHQFYLSTGTTIDFYLMVFTLTHLADNARVIGNEVPADIYYFLVLYIAVLAVAPWYIYRRQSRLNGPAPGQEHGETRGSWVLAFASFTFLFAATLPGIIAVDDGSLVRAPTVNVALSAADSLQESLTVSSVEVLPTTLNARIQPAMGDEGGATTAPRNLVFLVLESVRASASTIHAPDLKTTPFMADLAARSTVAQNAYAVVPHSSKALVAILCGIEPNFHMPITEAFPGRIPGRCLPQLLREHGYQSAFFQSATQEFENRKQLVANFGFDDFRPGDDMDPTGMEMANYFGYEDNIMLAPSREWLLEHRDKPFFTTYFTLTAHHDYLAPTRYGRHDFSEDELFNRYLNAVHYVDRFVANIFAQYKELGIYEDTIFVIVGDHGEAFGEHGRYQHDNVPYQEGTHIPMLIFDPQNPTPRSVEYNVNHLDLLPSAVKSLGFEIVAGEFPGTPLAEVDRERRLFMNCWYERRCMAEIFGDEKYIYHFGAQPDEFFNLSEDPLETKNLAATRDDLGERRQRLLEWRSRAINLHEGYAKTLKSK
ncbi:phosphoglycerol transferase MdoB-like AlkP superfamily enzyme [Bradymonas sediminis]|nr:phosphoglycerol transferase MdoB-like AlkP superfamily enzyme [Bradymonas sediminis]